jgi:hypothetical protein
MMLEGRARLFSGDVNIDYIISSRRKRETIDAMFESRCFGSGGWVDCVSVRP